MGGSVGVLKERPLDKVFALAAPGWARRGPGAEPAAATIGAAGAVLPDDLGERTMIGDAGAHALGAALGAAVVAGNGRAGLVAHVAAVCGDRVSELARTL